MLNFYTSQIINILHFMRRQIIVSVDSRKRCGRERSPHLLLIHLFYYLKENKKWRLLWRLLILMVH